ncbi:reverse transcriptase [Plakobranchus ocellatus]|uniref:Reverse transcriptase n=1 Tax=Plakobranchus ocellatus TaxID=259542 RepID=A0AAV4C6F8_9GAST|nr:reverse transcriptase [Plakobranchus ocellatus]
MLEDYVNGFKMTFSTERYTTDWINVEIGIAMGCTISPILFVLAMEVILSAAERSASPADLGGGFYKTTRKAFIHDRHYDPVLKGKRDTQHDSSV